MQVYTNTNRESIKTFLFFIFVLCISYLPVSSFLFFIKNDAFNGYFPSRFFISESLQSGHLPFWNPYINFGLPQYGDMNSGFWSPVTWLMATTVGYNAYTFTIEVLMYILTAGIGMYLLCRSFRLIRQVCFIAGIAYMCCGYIVGHLQHFNWISGAAFLPLALWGYYRLSASLSLKNVLFASFMFYLLAASAHPGITIGSLYFFAAFAVYLFFLKKTPSAFSKRLIAFTKTHALLLIATCLLAIGMIAGYSDILPHFTRGEKINKAVALAHPVSVQSLVSAVLPFSVVKNDAFFNTDISMRNVYFSMTLLIFFLVGLPGKKNLYQKFFLFTGLAFLLLSLGGIFKVLAYDYLPLIGYVRLNGEFSIFWLLCFILVSAFSLHKYAVAEKTAEPRLKIVLYLLAAFFTATVLWGCYKIFLTHDSIIHKLDNISAQHGLIQKLKYVIDNISFYDTLWMQGLIQLIVLWLIKSCLLNRQFSRLIKVCVADLVIATLMNIPFTGTGKASVAEVQAVLNKSPQGIIIPPLNAGGPADTISAYQTGLVGDWSFYNKAIDTRKFAFYPIELNTTKMVFNNGEQNWLGKPYLFCTGDSSEGTITVDHFTGNRISVSVEALQKDTLVYKQNTYPHWYIINGDRKENALTYNGLFLSAPLVKGSNNIQFVFDPSLVKTAMLISAIFTVLFLIILVWLFFKPFYLSWRRQ